MASFLELILGEVGQPYVYGGDTPRGGFDCSGLGYWAAGASGISGIPRTSQQMFAAMQPTRTPSPGDFIFMDNGSGNPQPDHVAYVVDPSRRLMVSADHPGDTVRVQTWDGWNVVGFRRLPTGSAGRDVTSGIRTTGITLPGIGDTGIPNPLDAGASAVGDLVASIPTAFLHMLIGDHTLNEIVIRSLETVGGAIILAVGGVLLLKVVAQGETGRAGRGAKSAALSVGGAYVGARKGVQRQTARSGATASRGARAGVTRSTRTVERPSEDAELARARDRDREWRKAHPWKPR